MALTRKQLREMGLEDDIIESIEEMKYYRAQFLKLPQ